MRFVSIAVLLPIFWALPDTVRAQERDGDALREFLACGQIEDAQDRLDCYDSVHRRHDPSRAEADDGQSSNARQTRNDASDPEDDNRQTVTNRVNRAPAATERRRKQASPGSRVMREAGPDDMELPVETVITRFGMNSSGDFRLQIREGWIFERAGGPPAEENLKGRTVTLEKNFMGNWRMKLPEVKRPFWISPVLNE